jgi:hypothetical protein
MNVTRWLPGFVTMVAAWQESGENPAVFCYLMLWGAFALLHDSSRPLIPAIVRLETACSRPFATFFTRSTIPTNSHN